MTDFKPYLQLVRVPNLFTAAADVLAGALFVGARFELRGDLLPLIAASVCFYAGGVVLNDVLDAPRDAVDRPQRPIPSGAVPRSRAATIATALLIIGWTLCASVSAHARSLGLFLIASILLYNGFLKRTALAPAVMGMCRALNLLLGMSVAVDAPGGKVMYAAALIWLYTASVTYFARFEASTSARARLRIGSAGVILAVMALVGVQSFLDPCNTAYLLLVGVLLGQVAVAARRAVATGSPGDVQRAVQTFVVSLVLFDGCLAFAAQGPLAAALVVTLIVPSIGLSRRFKVT